VFFISVSSTISIKKGVIYIKGQTFGGAVATNYSPGPKLWVTVRF